MNRFTPRLALVCVVVFLTAASGTGKTGGTAAIPSHPSKLGYAPLGWTVPLGSSYRVELPNGLRAYVASDSQLPLVQMNAYIRSGTLLDPPGKEGLSDLLAALMRSGGTERFPPDTLDALIDRYAVRISVKASNDLMELSASFLSDFLDTGMEIATQMLLFPRFDDTKLEKERAIFIEATRHRFDNPGPSLDAAFDKALYAGTRASAISTARSLGQISRGDLLALHRRTVFPANMIVAVAGRFDRPAMLSLLEKKLPAGGKREAVEFPLVKTNSPVRCLVVHKPVSQAYVRFGLPLFKRPNPDYYAVSVANLILGGGGFTSRLSTEVRSDEGLTYSIHSNAESNYTFPGTWHVQFFTKNESFSKAMDLTLRVIDSLKKNGVTAEELANAKASLIDEMPSMFRSPFDIVSTYAWNEYYGRPATIFRDYPDSIRAITRGSLQKALAKYLDQAAFVYTVVGDTAALGRYGASGTFDFHQLQPRKIVAPDSIPALP